MERWFFWLIFFHFSFFRKFYFQNFYHYARSEPLEHEFPSARLLGENLKQGKFLGKDEYFYPYFNSLPWNSSFYPPHMVLSWLISLLPLNPAFILYSWVMVLHYLFASICAYILFQSLNLSSIISFFGAVTLTHFSYCVKQNNSIAYTLGWFPLLLLGARYHSILIFGISLGMIILGGYWPLGIYMGAFGCLFWLFS